MMTDKQMERQTPAEVAFRAVKQDGPVVLAAKPMHGSTAPLDVARWLARREDRDLEVVSVLRQGDVVAIAAGMPPLPAAYLEAERREMAERLQQELAPDDTTGMPLRVDVLDGPPARTVVEAARSRAARVIVIGTGGHDVLERHVFGEHALQILSLADRPVLVVPAGAHAGTVTTAVVAVDFSPASVRAARAVIPMLSQGSRLHLVHVRHGEHGAFEMATWPDSVPAARCDEQFRAFLRQMPTMLGIAVHTHTLWGDPAQCVVDFASRRGAGLIACGRMGRSFVERLFVRSVSNDVVRHAPCPVLVVPDAAKD